MGVAILNPAADYSARNLGNIYPWVQILDKMGVTNSAFRTAFTTFYKGLQSNGLLNKFAHAYVFGGGTALADSIDIVTQDPTYRLSFANDISGAHTVDGFVTSIATSRVAFIPAVIPQLTNFGLHVCHSNVIAVGTAPILAGVGESTSPANYRAAIKVGADGNWGGWIDVNDTPSSTNSNNTAYSGSTGLKSMTITGGNLRSFYISGIKRGNDTKAIAPVLGGSRPVCIGGLGVGNTAQGVINATIRFAAMSTTAWTDADEANLNALLTTLEAAI